MTCIGKDPRCPCQDGDACHYKDCGGTKALPVPVAQPEQEPVAWILTDENINSIQVASVQRLIDRLKHAHHTDLCVRINGQDEWFQADWLKHMVRATPPAAQPPPEWELIKNILDEYGLQAISFLAEWKAAQRPWVGLTDEEIWSAVSRIGTADSDVNPYITIKDARAIEQRLKERNT